MIRMSSYGVDPRIEAYLIEQGIQEAPTDEAEAASLVDGLEAEGVAVLQDGDAPPVDNFAAHDAEVPVTDEQAKHFIIRMSEWLKSRGFPVPEKGSEPVKEVVQTKTNESEGAGNNG